MNSILNVRTTLSSLLALSLLAGVAGKTMASENDNDRSTYNAKEFYEKLDRTRE